MTHSSEIQVKTAAFKIGNKVRVKRYEVQTMSGLWVDGWMVGMEGYVQGFSKDYDWRRDFNQATVRLYSDMDKNTGEYEHVYSCEVPLDNLELIEACEGEVVPGKTCPFSRSELREMFVKQQLAEVEKYDFSAQGYKNMATHIAAMYLNQDSRFHRQLERMRRADGTVNPNKVRKAFDSLGLEVDDSAFEIPEAFMAAKKGYYRNIIDAIRAHQSIDWNEVADDFAQAS